jgi:hypothetical protein
MVQIMKGTDIKYKYFCSSMMRRKLFLRFTAGRRAAENVNGSIPAPLFLS